MRKRLTVLAAAAAPLVALTLGTGPAHADTPVNVVFEGGAYCLDIPGNNAVVGQALMAWQCSNTDPAEQWNYITVDQTHFELQSVTNTNLCANDWQGGDVSGNDVKLYYCNGDADGVWNNVAPRSNVNPIQPKSALNNCLNIWGGLANGNPAKLYQCASVPNENVAMPYVS
ncbi:RICIN domain-containing protein [Streptacidiphilus anmyonensis]|uniref:RICIN domain-containing protein n=1 Tax=Streptacidiphilus anmyonensis TaxID=405782 RepID=UPI0005A80B42|nr:RICIN domain-containing protein [Streptacidiphilus anmyonensis]